MKPIEFLGDSLDQLRCFPISVRRSFGFQLSRLQAGLEPNDWKPMKTVGQGVRELRTRDSNGAFRVLYVASIGNAVYVLHSFQKKTQATAGFDIKIATERYKELLRSIRT